MSWKETALIAIVSAIAGGVITISARWLADILSQQMELLRVFRRNGLAVMESCYQLYRRLQNTLCEGNYKLLAQSRKPEPHWPATHEDFMESTQYFFGAFFACLERYNSEVLFLPYGRHKANKEFRKLVREAQRKLYDVSLNTHKLRDHQVYLLEQKAMGEVLLLGGGSVPIMGFLEFRNRLRKEPEFREAFLPVWELMVDLEPGNQNFRFARLELFAGSLKALYDFLAKNTHGDVYGLTKKFRETGDSRLP